MECPQGERASPLSHKADNSFFDEKRYWSERKDRILGSYLTAYLPKIATRSAPILLVDGFAGPGQFGDGKPGSPWIMCDSVSKFRERSPSHDVKVLCIEADDELASRLEQRLQGFDFATIKHSSFSEQVDQICSLAATHSVFLYVDPFTVEGIVWSELDRVFEHLSRSGMSIEILLNFNGPSFVRRGLAALKREVPPIDPEIEDTQEIDLPMTGSPSQSRLTTVLGTDAWIGELSRDSPFSEQVQRVTSIMKRNLSLRFKETGEHAVFAEPHHRVPKYSLIFGSRSAHALVLFNDEFVKSTASLAERALPEGPMLFETRSEALVPDAGVIPELIRRHAKRPNRRGDLIIAVIRENFGRFSKSQVRGAIEQMLKCGKLQSATGRTRINDEVQVWVPRDL